jgi:hypothetical protein
MAKKGLNRPKTFKPNRAANRNATRKKTVFWDLKPDTTTRVRVVPPLTEDGLIFTKATNHYGVENEDGFNIAPACLNEHGDGDCWLCRLVNYLFSTGDKGDENIAKRLKANGKWYIQGFVWDGEKYDGPYLVGLSKTTADKVNDIFDQLEAVGDPDFCDPDEGRDLVITRTGSGFSTKYSVMPGSKIMALDDIVPGWEDKVFHDVIEKIDPRIMSNEDQRAAVVRTLGDSIDWETIDKEVPIG